MALPELGHALSALIGVACLLHLVLIFFFAIFLKGHVCLFLPGFVDLIAFRVLFDLATTFIPFLSNHLALSIDSLKRIALLDFVPLHHRLAFYVEGFVIWDQIQGDIFQEILLLIGPQEVFPRLFVEI